jgi:hypothetical protein
MQHQKRCTQRRASHASVVSMQHKTTFKSLTCEFACFASATLVALICLFLPPAPLPDLVPVCAGPFLGLAAPFPARPGNGSAADTACASCSCSSGLEAWLLGLR